MNAPSESTATPTRQSSGNTHRDDNHRNTHEQGNQVTLAQDVDGDIESIQQTSHGDSITRATDKTCSPEEITRQLEELPDLCARLQAGDIDGPTRASRRTRRDPAEHAPVNLARLDALDHRSKLEVLNHVDRVGQPHPDGRRVGQGENRLGILPTLDGWAVLLEDDMLDRSPQLPDPLPDPPTVAGACQWLARHLHWWTSAPQWDEFSADINRQHRRALALTGWQPDDRQVHVGTGGCGGTVTHIGGDMWRCQGCGNERSLRSAATTTIPAAAKLLRLPERTLRSWAARNLITPIDPDAGERQREYPLAEVMRVRDEMGSRRVVR